MKTVPVTILVTGVWARIGLFPRTSATGRMLPRVRLVPPGIDRGRDRNTAGIRVSSAGFREADAGAPQRERGGGQVDQPPPQFPPGAVGHPDSFPVGFLQVVADAGAPRLRARFVSW